jgi:hypothetical protein
MLRLGHCNNLVPNSSRLGCSNQTKMHFNLHHLIQKHDLHQIEAPFTKEDIDNIVRKCLWIRLLGPMALMHLHKKCWHIIKEDIYQLCFDFFEERIDLQAINNSLIILIPKVNSPT